jgi:iron complex outermembrane receptor protein
LATAGGGTEEHGFGAIRYGGKVGETGFARLYGKYYNRGPGYLTTDPNPDDSSGAGQVGFRSDWGGEIDSVTVQGDSYIGDFGNLNEARVGRTNTDGTNILGRWTHRHSANSKSILQGYVDYNYIGLDAIAESRTTYDIDLQNESSLSKSNFLVTGIEYRGTRDSIKLSPPIQIDPTERQDDLFSLFFQDRQEISEGLNLIAGARLEHNDYTDTEVQPTARASWLIDEKNSVWAAYSRALRIPSRIESDQSVDLGPDLVFSGNPELDAELLDAYEIGYRRELESNMYFDVATFVYKYDRLVTLEGLTLGNGAQALNYGGEVAVAFSPRQWWTLNGSYSLLRMQLDLDPDSIADRNSSINRVEHSNPVHQVRFGSEVDIGEDWEWNMNLRYVDSLPALDVGSYVVADINLRYRASKTVEIAVVGQNLFQSHHFEQSPASSTEVQHGVYGKLTWLF